jgi:apolipoprotein D and lipocalin family protein
LDRENYQYAFVTGPKKSYLWLLARTQKVDESVLDLFIETSRKLGYDIDKLIYVDQS